MTSATPGLTPSSAACRSCTVIAVILILLGACGRGHGTLDEGLAGTLVTKLALAGNATVADIGAGDGTIAAAFAGAVPRGHVIATELRRRDVDRLVALEAPRLEARIATMTDSALRDPEPVNEYETARSDNYTRTGSGAGTSLGGLIQT